MTANFPIHPSAASGSSSNSNDSGTKMVCALASFLPSLLFEAKIQGGRIGGQLATNLGFTFPTTKNHLDVAIFTRSSGAAFAVCISSFVAYKLLYRLIQTNCLFSALEQFSPEKEEQTKCGERMVEFTEGFYAVRLGGENDLLRRLEDCLSENGSPKNNKNKVAVVQVRQASALKQLFQRNTRIRRAGIAALDQCSSGEEEPLEELAPNRRDILLRYGRQRKRMEEDDEQSTLSGFSNLTSASRIAPNRRHSPSSPIPSILPEHFPECDTPPTQKSPKNRNSWSSRNSSYTSKSSSRRSASLRLNCDNELYWENEFSTNSECLTDVEMDFEGDDGLFLFREREGSLGGISQLSAMKNLEEMFSGNWQQEGEDGEHLLDSALGNLRGMDKLIEANASTSSMMEFIKQREKEEQKAPKILHDSSFPFTAYRIVVQNNEFDTSTEMSSICRSSRSGPYEKHKLLHQQNIYTHSQNSHSQGLWELTGNDKNSRVKFEKTINANSDYQERQQEGMLNRGQMFDSVISSHSSLASNSAHQRSKIGTIGQQLVGDGGIMYDSAICTDFQSSGDDEDWRENCIDQQIKREEEEKGRIRPTIKSGILRKYGYIDDRPLSKISEQSTPIKRVSTPSTGIRPPSPQGSEPSLEWF